MSYRGTIRNTSNSGNAALSMRVNPLRAQELSGPNAVAAYFEVKRLVISPKDAGGFTLLTSGRAERLENCPPLGLGDRHARDFPQRKLGRRGARTLRRPRRG